MRNFFILASKQDNPIQRELRSMGPWTPTVFPSPCTSQSGTEFIAVKGNLIVFETVLYYWWTWIILIHSFAFILLCSVCHLPAKVLSIFIFVTGLLTFLILFCQSPLHTKSTNYIYSCYKIFFKIWMCYLLFFLYESKQHFIKKLFVLFYWITDFCCQTKIYFSYPEII